MSNDKKEPWREIVESVLMTRHGLLDEVAQAAVEAVAMNVYLEFAPVASPAAVRAEGFAAGLQRARDLLDTDAAAAESYARGQAAEAERVQARAVASATRATMYRNGVDLLSREIASLRGEGK